MGLTVLSVAFPLAPVGVDAAGGAEQVLSLVERGLERRGHRSIVVACSGSRAAGELAATPRAAGLVDDAARQKAWRAHRDAICGVLARERVDVVHLHGLDFVSYLPGPGVPALATLHLPPSFYPPDALRPARPDTHLLCVSLAQRRACPPGARIAAVVPNGVDVAALGSDEPPRPMRAREGVVALGRLCPEKGFPQALDAARRAGVGCRLAGRLFPYASHRRHFEQEIRPRLDAERVFVGPVGLAGKRSLLGDSVCLLVPSLVEETSSLVAMEALACGTPVVAFARGALPEIVDHGRTGFLVEDVEAMARAIAECRSLDPAACRQAARERFSAETMLDRYLALYQALAEPVRARGGARAEA